MGRVGDGMGCPPYAAGMDVSLRTLSTGDLGPWIERTNREYQESRIAAGESPEVAAAKARESRERSFPGGQPAPGHLVHEVVVPGVAGTPEVVGHLWIAPSAPGSADWWVFDVEIAEEHRGHGYGRAAMQLAETAAAAHGARTLGLNVFGYNTVARGLYESLGYETTAVQMRKPLAPDAV